MKTSYSIVLLVITAAGLGSCGGLPGAKSAKQANAVVGLSSGLLSSLRFNANPTTALSGIAPGMGNIPAGTFTLNGVNATRMTATAAACGYTSTPESAALIDVDKDGIPVTVKYTFDYDSEVCSSKTAEAGSKFTFKGSFTAKDLDDSLKWSAGGFGFDWDYTGTFSQATSSFEYVGNGTYTGKQSGASYAFAAKYGGDVKFSYGSKSGKLSYLGDMKYTVTPDDASSANFGKSGKVKLLGSWTYSGDRFEEEEGSSSSSDTSADVTFTAESFDLAYDSTNCSEYWKTGKFTFDVGNGHKFEIRYDCTSYKYYFDGKEYDPAKDK